VHRRGHAAGRGGGAGRRSRFPPVRATARVIPRPAASARQIVHSSLGGLISERLEPERAPPWSALGRVGGNRAALRFF
jgi:hypothetical protein